MAENTTTLPETMSEFRKALTEVEAARTAAAALIKAASRGNESVAAAMAPMVQSQVETLSAAMKNAAEALAAVVAAASIKSAKPAKAA